MTINHTRKFLRLQGYEFDDASFDELARWMRWPYVFCASAVVAGVTLASPWILWGLAAFAASTVFLPSHPFNYPYNYVVRHITGTRALPPGTTQGKFGCGMGALMLVGIGYAFYTGATTVGYALGGAMAAMVTFLAVTQICIPSLLYKALFGHKTISVTQPA
ncbi:MAG: DUF4395 family protein [Myxococcales bacterium]|nr:MAG: DUF4395 family protein [Myxococcales bacterium]